MQPDDTVCYCYHVSLRKLMNFARRERPEHASRMSECLGAGTGCGWCIPYLCRIAESADEPAGAQLDITPEEYAAARQAYRRKGEKNRFE